MMDTMSPIARGYVSAADAQRLDVALKAQADAAWEVRQAVLAAAKNGASVRELALFTGLSTNTISRWKRDDK
jgi:transposase-like protein